MGWETYVRAQRSLFAAVWVQYVEHELAVLNELLATPRHKSDIPAVGAIRVAALYAAEWMADPQRLARSVGSRARSDETDANRSAVRVIIYLVSGALTGLHRDIKARWGTLAQGLDVDVADRLRRAPATRWREVQAAALRYGFDDAQCEEREDFATTAKEFGLVLENEVVGRPPWIPLRANTWFTPSATMPLRSTQEKRHAVVDAFFLDEYQRMEPPRRSPVRLLATYPSDDLVDEPARGGSTAAYEQDCRDRDLDWMRRFTAAASAHDVRRLAVDALRGAQDDVDRHQSPPVSALVSEVPVVAVVLGQVGALDLGAKDLTSLAERAIGKLAPVLAHGREQEQRVAVAVLDWIIDGCPAHSAGALQSLVEALPRGSLLPLLTQLSVALDSAFAELTVRAS